MEVLPAAGIVGKIVKGIIQTNNIVKSAVGAGAIIYNLCSGEPNCTFNAVKIALGGYYLDENRFLGGAIQGWSRNTWGSAQNSIGNVYSHIRNISNKVSRVDYFGGATFVTDENAGTRQGITLGDYANIDLDSHINKAFEKYILEDPLLMHEFGHTIDSTWMGPGYLIMGLRSLSSAKNSSWIPGTYYTTHRNKSYERRANRNASRYFGEFYGVDWMKDLYTDSYGRTGAIVNFYPL